MITIYPTGAAETTGVGSRFFDALTELTGLRIIPFSSARAAIVYGLRAMGVGRVDEILVPPYLSHCVTSALGRTAFPAMTPSERTKAILVLHQFGYPQRIDYIEEVAVANGWFIVNNCAHTVFTRFHDKRVLLWGDFSVLSFPKLYHCNLGGGLIVRHNGIQKWVDGDYARLAREHAKRANQAYQVLSRAKQNPLGAEEQFDINAVYGYLPEVVAYPSQALASLPNTAQELRQDSDRRRGLADIVRARFPDRVPDTTGCDVVPFAVPVQGEPVLLERASLKIKKHLGVEAPVLHFDFARNMLEPDYRKALVIGCHSGWQQKCVRQICDICDKVLS